jgi:hypothetical protein
MGHWRLKAYGKSQNSILANGFTESQRSGKSLVIASPTIMKPRDTSSDLMQGDNLIHQLANNIHESFTEQ